MVNLSGHEVGNGGHSQGTPVDYTDPSLLGGIHAYVEILSSRLFTDRVSYQSNAHRRRY